MAEGARADVALAARGLARSRTEGAALVKAGAVLMDGVPVRRPSQAVPDGARLELAGAGPRYVSRAAHKLVSALEAFSVAVAGRRALDAGASTGGFTQVLLERGARRVIALDVGHGQLDPRIAGNERIIEMSGVNIRDVEADDLPYRPSMIVSDVSFISLTYVIPVIARIAAPGAHVVLLVKPQFEVGKGNLGKNGIVESETLRKQALDTVTACAKANGLDVRATAVSPIEGTHGNIEYLLYAVA